MKRQEVFTFLAEYLSQNKKDRISVKPLAKQWVVFTKKFSVKLWNGICF